MQEYYEQFYADEFDSLDKMDRFLKRQTSKINSKRNR